MPREFVSDEPPDPPRVLEPPEVTLGPVLIGLGVALLGAWAAWGLS